MTYFLFVLNYTSTIIHKCRHLDKLSRARRSFLLSLNRLSLVNGTLGMTGGIRSSALLPWCR